jgi:hypothetical protein
MHTARLADRKADLITGVLQFSAISTVHARSLLTAAAACPINGTFV